MKDNIKRFCGNDHSETSLPGCLGFCKRFLTWVAVTEYKVSYEREAPLASSSWKEQALQSILEPVRLNARIRSLDSFAACLLLL